MYANLVIQSKTLIDLSSEPNLLYKCILVDEKGETHEEMLHQSEVELIELMTLLQKSLQLYPNTMKEIWEKIDNYAKYQSE
jgi:hypothetical protein